MIQTRTPFRISLFGGGTDFVDWSSERGGCVLSFSIDHYCHLSVRQFPPFFEHRYRVVYSAIELTESIAAIIHPVVRATLERFEVASPVELIHHGDLPAQSGIGSSSAFTVGTVAAIFEMLGRPWTPADLAFEAIAIEREVLREAGGIQDQVAVATGGLNELRFRGVEWEVRPIGMTSDQLRYFESHMVLVYSGVKRSSPEISQTTSERIRTSTDVLSSLKGIAREAATLIRSGNYTYEIGALLQEARRLKRELNPLTESPLIAGLLDSGLEAGALGAKVLGAGGGGFVLFWMRPEDRQRFSSSLKTGVVVPFKVESQGVRVSPIWNGS